MEVLAYCFMSNHFHILVYVPDPYDLSDDELWINLHARSEDNIAGLRGSFDFRLMHDDVIDAMGPQQKVHGVEAAC